jgi:hypothetical protein
MVVQVRLLAQMVLVALMFHQSTISLATLSFLVLAVPLLELYARLLLV